MMSMEVPSQPWHTVGADLFQYKGKWYILVTDLYSKAPFIRYVPNTSAHAAIKAMKGIFAENGIPVKVVSDNGPHFSAREYERFAAKWGFQVILSSPEYPQGHALIERHIQTVKKCMYKCDASGYDFDLAMLVVRSTPLNTDLPSPAELLHGRRFRTTLPTYVPDPQLTEVIRKKLQAKQEKAAANYDKTARAKPELTPGQNVRLYNKPTKRWEPARITGLASTPRSYFVQRMDGGMLLRRNRVQLKPTIENWDGKRFQNDSYDTDPLPEDLPDDEQPEGDGGVSTTVMPPPPPSSPHCVVPELRRTPRDRKKTVFYQAGGNK